MEKHSIGAPVAVDVGDINLDSLDTLVEGGQAGMAVSMESPGSVEEGDEDQVQEEIVVDVVE